MDEARGGNGNDMKDQMLFLRVLLGRVFCGQDRVEVVGFVQLQVLGANLECWDRQKRWASCSKHGQQQTAVVPTSAWRKPTSSKKVQGENWCLLLSVLTLKGIQKTSARPW
jgi:hypothetical protein